MPQLQDQPQILPADLLELLEAILMVATEPVDPHDLSQVTGIEPEVITEAFEELRKEYEGSESQRPRGFELRSVNGKWRIYARSKWYEVARIFLSGTRNARLSAAALETLAVVAYRQPITRAQISEIRGVNTDSVVRNLILRGMLVESGEGENGAINYCTTDLFLESFGLKDLGELPPLAPHYPTVETLPEVLSEIEDLKR
ncbi:SMC-Scp complex subunit ScpB [Boudabousia liubingyangii]|uniref:SMC-Scp complex subunit ScpB n=1 Tax=Boudabousia liubingyangii TaxID=1921764 RepID=A0A1Q5PNL5_9ACTO|nr:SMC-Scp complex subunit ScpB [Boudabousia liubingyangii]OKL47710.1 SMC-Scp complex subunit ScpB [Boudabousia liubingyangii]OKL49136.1 SMC-Scp complex subunit ScpB [Boudabousia liubingyangii]